MQTSSNTNIVKYFSFQQILYYILSLHFTYRTTFFFVWRGPLVGPFVISICLILIKWDAFLQRISIIICVRHFKAHNPMRKLKTLKIKGKNIAIGTRATVKQSKDSNSLWKSLSWIHHLKINKAMARRQRVGVVNIHILGRVSCGQNVHLEPSFNV